MSAPATYPVSMAHNYVRRRCPICWQRVRPTTTRMIEGHWDSQGLDICPASSEPYRITLTLSPSIRDMVA